MGSSTSQIGFQRFEVLRSLDFSCLPSISNDARVIRDNENNEMGSSTSQIGFQLFTSISNDTRMIRIIRIMR